MPSPTQNWETGKGVLRALTLACIHDIFSLLTTIHSSSLVLLLQLPAPLSSASHCSHLSYLLYKDISEIPFALVAPQRSKTVLQICFLWPVQWCVCVCVWGEGVYMCMKFKYGCFRLITHPPFTTSPPLLVSYFRLFPHSCYTPTFYRAHHECCTHALDAYFLR